MPYLQADDSISEKLEGSLVNALVFIAIVGSITFGLVLLLKHGYSRIIFIYLAFSGFTTFFVILGAIFLELVQKSHLHADVISFFFVLTNFSVVGAVTMFSMPAPLFVKQCYLVAISCSVAFIFTFVPEWSTWVLLLALVLYDIGAVLSPVGPLKMLVELAAERDEDIPALIYESRARNAPRSDDPSVSSNASLGNRDELESGISVSEPQTEIETVARLHIPSEARGTEALPLESSNKPDDTKTEYILDLPEGIKLGLGDFIFYSVLVGRSAMFDMLTMMACFLAILTGLVCTLLWLAVSQKALPALPISISLGVVFYFASRFLLEPVIVPMTLSMLVL